MLIAGLHTMRAQGPGRSPEFQVIDAGEYVILQTSAYPKVLYRWRLCSPYLQVKKHVDDLYVSDGTSAA